MKIVLNSQKLRLDDTLLMRVAGTVFVGLGLFLLSSAKLTTLSCDREESSQSSCQLISSGLFDFQGAQTKPIKLQAAKLEDNPMDANAARVILQTSDGYLHFTSSTSGDKAEATVSDINAFAQKAKVPSLILHHDNRGVYFPLGASIITVGIFTFIFFRNSRLQA